MPEPSPNKTTEALHDDPRVPLLPSPCEAMGAVGNLALDMVSFAVDVPARAAWSAAAWIQGASGAAADLAVSALTTKIEDLMIGAGSVVTATLRQAGVTVDYTLSELAGDPAQPKSVHERGFQLAVGLIPIIGSAQGIAEARGLYRMAATDLSEKDAEDIRQQARRTCLVMCTALSLEVMTCGASGIISNALNVGNGALSVLNLGKVAREESRTNSWIPKIDLDFLSPRLDALLEYPEIHEAMEIVLRFDPEKDL